MLGLKILDRRVDIWDIILTQASAWDLTLLSTTYGYKEEGIKHEVANKTLFEAVSWE
jgi:hypothetical protein